MTNETTTTENLGIPHAGLSDTTPIFGSSDSELQRAANEIATRREAAAQAGQLPSGVADHLTKDIVGGIDLTPS
jgi:hypothetical protein